MHHQRTLTEDGRSPHGVGEKSPGQDVPTQEAAARDVPARDVPARDVPARDVPAGDWPTQEALTQEALTQEAASHAALDGGRASRDRAGGDRAKLAAWVEDFRTGLAQHGTFEIDAERLPTLNAELRGIISVAEHVLADARELHAVQAPAYDEVSVRSTGRLNDVGTESIVRTCEEIHDWLLRLQTQVGHALGHDPLGGPLGDPEPHGDTKRAMNERP